MYKILVNGKVLTRYIDQKSQTPENEDSQVNLYIFETNIFKKIHYIKVCYVIWNFEGKLESKRVMLFLKQLLNPIVLYNNNLELDFMFWTLCCTVYCKQLF